MVTKSGTENVKVMLEMQILYSVPMRTGMPSFLGRFMLVPMFAMFHPMPMGSMKLHVHQLLISPKKKNQYWLLHMMSMTFRSMIGLEIWRLDSIQLSTIQTTSIVIFKVMLPLLSM